LIVVAALGLFGMAVLLPALQGVRDADHKKKTMNNLKVIGLALHNCSDAYKKLPPAFGPFGGIKFNAPVHVHLLPFEEELKLYNAYLQNEGKGDTAERLVAIYRAEEESLAGDKARGAQNFAANLRVFSDNFRKVGYDKDGKDLDGVHKCSIGIFNGFPDGTSNTVVAATKFAVCGEGGSRYAGELSGKYAAFFGQNAAQKPADPADATATFQLQPSAKECRTSPLMAQSLTKKGLLVCLADVVVRGVSPSVSAETWNRALCPHDGLPNGKDWDN
jgi:Protein of unknown function (DUF1559)